MNNFKWTGCVITAHGGGVVVRREEQAPEDGCYLPIPMDAVYGYIARAVAKQEPLGTSRVVPSPDDTRKRAETCLTDLP